MPTVLDILIRKGNEIHSIHPAASVMEAVQNMNTHGVGALVVMKDDTVVGMFTERDVLRRVLAEQRRPDQVMIADVMTAEVICCSADTDITDASQIMQSRRIRHLPVCGNDGRIIGMVSIGDLNAFYASHQEQTIHYLQDYIYGRA
jgi:CBS domain-containing protein